MFIEPLLTVKGKRYGRCCVLDRVLFRYCLGPNQLQLLRDTSKPLNHFKRRLFFELALVATGDDFVLSSCVNLLRSATG